MAGKLLDTNAVIAYFKRDGAIQKLIDVSINDIYLPSVAIGELYYGAQISGRVAANISQIKMFIVDKVVLPCDTQTSEQYGLIRSQLRAKGRPIPANDVWIAAIAQQHDLILITRDQHFDEIDDLKLEKW